MDSDAEAILNIPLNPIQCEDMVTWDLDSRGCFNVRSAYRLGTTLTAQQNASSSNHQSQEGLWKKFWKINIPTKIKICGWRTFNDILPTLTNLISRGVDVHHTCVFCRKYPESASHLFWECKKVSKLWSFFCPWSYDFGLYDRGSLTPADYFMTIWKKVGSDSIDSQRIATSLILCWQIWTHRNMVTQCNNKVDMPMLEAKIQYYLAEFLHQKNLESDSCTWDFDQTADTDGGDVLQVTNHPNAVAAQRRTTLWIPPPIGSCKLNRHAMWSTKHRRGGVAWILRDWCGRPLRGGGTNVCIRFGRLLG